MLTTIVRGVRLGLLAVVLLVWPALVRAATDLERFERRLGKSTVLFDGLPGAQTTTCVCKDGSERTNQAGVLTRLRLNAARVTFRLECTVLEFDPETGAFDGSNGCSTWELLPK